MAPAKSSRARKIMDRLELTPNERERLTRVLPIIRDMLDPEHGVQVSAVAQELTKIHDRLAKRSALSPDDVKHLTQVLQQTLKVLNPEQRTNIAATARQLGKSRRTIYNWVDRILEATVVELRDIRVGRPSKRSTESV